MKNSYCLGMVILTMLMIPGPFFLGAETIDLDEMESLNHGESDCSEVRLDKNGGPTSNIPTRDQGEVGSCTAHASAILIDAHLAKKHPPPSLLGPPAHLTSPFPLYVNEKINSNFTGAFDGNAGSDIPQMIQAAKSAGSCDLSDSNYDKAAFEQLMRNLKFHDEMIRDLEALSRPGRVLTSEEKEDKTMWSNMKAGVVSIIMCRMEKFFHLPTGVVAAAKANQLLDLHQQAKFWNEYLKEKCVSPATKLTPDELDLPKLEVISRLKGPGRPAHANKTVADLQRAIDQNLTQKRQPVGIGYCSSFLGKPYPNINHGVQTFQKSQDAKTQEERDAAARNCGMHASVIVGRQWRFDADGKRQCMYLIQNSWGTGLAGCLNYHNSRASPSTRFWIDDMDCEMDGKVWVSQTELANVVDVNFFK